MIKRTISGMIGAGSLAHNRRDFVAENVDWDRVQLNICYKNENLKKFIKSCLTMQWRDTMSGKERTDRLQIIMKKSERANRRSCSMK